MTRLVFTKYKWGLCRRITTAATNQEVLINALTKEIFQNSIVSLKFVENLLEKKAGVMTFNNFSFLIGCSARKKVKLRNSQLHVISKSLSTIACESKVEDIGQLLYGLHLYDDKQSDILAIVDVSNAHLKRLDTQGVALSARAIENAMYGLRNMTSESSSVLGLLETVSVMIGGCTEVFSSTQVSNSLNGLRCMRGDSAPVKELVHALSLKMKGMHMAMNSREVGNALHGLRGIDNSSLGVREVLRLLSEHLGRSRQNMDCVSLSSALFGLQHMSSECVEVRGVVEALAQKVEEASTARVSFDNIGISNSLYGLQNMSSDHGEVKRLVSALTRVIHQSRGPPMTANHITNAIFGIQNLNPICNEVLDLVALLNERFEAYDGKFSAEQMGKCLIGVKNLTGSSGSAEAKLLVCNIQKSALSHKPFTGVKPVDVSRAVLGLSRMKGSSHFPALTRTVTLMCDSCLHTLAVSDIIMVLQGATEMDFADRDVQSLMSSLTRRVRRLRDEPSVLRVEGELGAVLARRATLNSDHYFNNLVAALGLKKRMAAWSQ